jgi:hypothetical protein
MLKKVFMIYFNVLSRHFPEKIEDNHKQLVKLSSHPAEAGTLAATGQHLQRTCLLSAVICV